MDGVSIKYKGAEIAQMGADDTKVLKTAGTYCEGDITVAASVRNGTHNMHIEYNNPADISGAGNYITPLAGSDILKRVRSYDTLLVIAHFASGAAGARVICSQAANAELYAPTVNAASSGRPRQAVIRITASAVYNDSTMVNRIDDDANITTGSGRIYITPEGDLRIYGNTTAYPIRAGLVTIDILWGDA